APAARISGRVTDVSGKPLGGVCLIALSFAAGDFEEAQTNPAGDYTLNELAPGPYKIFFNDAECSYFLNEDDDAINDEVANPVAFGSVWFNGRLSESTATEVTVTAHKTHSSVNAVAPDFGGITGSVTTATHAAIPGEC